jgi:glutamine phosphoribosylpyrophosphate amidotransferase
MSKVIRVPDTVYEAAIELSEEKDMSNKEAMRHLVGELDE